MAADTINVGYNQTITASGGTGTVTLVTNVTHAIAGLTVPASGTGSLAIGGTPTATGTETFTVTATDAVGGTTGAVSYSIVVNPAITLSPTSLAADTINVGYNQTIAASGGTGTVTLVTNVTHAIAGLTVPASGTGSLAITGTPTATGTETFTVTATDAVGGTTGAAVTASWSTRR